MSKNYIVVICKNLFDAKKSNTIHYDACTCMICIKSSKKIDLYVVITVKLPL